MSTHEPTKSFARTTQGAARLTYCTNIHPGETLDEVRELLSTHVSAVRQRVSPHEPFGVGLRLSAQAAHELKEPEALARFRELLAAHGLYVFTLNGFPYGGFHGTRVKQQVYAPDWRTLNRSVYTSELAQLLAALLPDEPDLYGSISTVPVGFRAALCNEGDHGRAARTLVTQVAELVDIERRTGKRIVLALEPEPFCVLETAGDAALFFKRHLFERSTLGMLADITGLAAGEAEAAVRRHLGLCLDACHASVVFDGPRAAVAQCQAAGIEIAKLQVSAGLEAVLGANDFAKLDALERFADDVYLHQVFEKRAGGVAAYLDLPEALAEARAHPAVERLWRTHFHVPVFCAQLGAFASTQAELVDLLQLQRERPFTQHLEVETYTWDVLPEEHRQLSVTDAIARELTWVRAELTP